MIDPAALTGLYNAALTVQDARGELVGEIEARARQVAPADLEDGTPRRRAA